MPRHILSLPAILAVGFATATANAAEKSEVNCRSGELVRRVIIEVGDLGTGLPCEVVYWKDSEAPGVRRVLWNARSDAVFCETKAAGLVEKLNNSGWECEASGETAAVDQAAAAPQPFEPQAEGTAQNNTAPALDAATVGNDVRPTEPALSDPAATAVAPDPLDTNSTETAALAPAAPSPTPEASEQLQIVIAQNLDSLNQSVDGDFKAEVGQFGDLNADGLDDAVVFFNYESSTADFTQFVAAYLFNGESYHLAATKPVGGTERAVEKVEVENIVDGSILLKLHLNDASQTENRSAAMTLKDGQLVEIE